MTSISNNKQTGQACRICLAKIRGNGIVISEDQLHSINKLLEIEVSLNDQWPHYLCDICRSKIQEFVDFKSLAQRSQEKCFNLYGPQHRTDEDNKETEDLVEIIEENQEENSRSENEANESEEEIQEPSTKTKKRKKDGSTLKRNKPRHNKKDQKFPCNICQREFTTKNQMSEHKKYVHSPTKLQCDHCDKKFTRPINLKEHIAASHTGQSLYTCSFCPKQFNSNSNKYSHQKAQHFVEWAENRLKKLKAK